MMTTPEPMSGCLLWTGKLDLRGYGVVVHKARIYRAHRMAWKLATGRSPPAHLDMCHKCDNRACVNPDHLFPGTRKENAHDCWRKGRGRPGSRKLDGSIPLRITDEVVARVLGLLGTGMTQGAVAKIVGISGGSVSNISRGAHRRVIV